MDLTKALAGGAAAVWAPEEVLEYVCWVVVNTRNFLRAKVLPEIKHPVAEAEFMEMLIIADVLHEHFGRAWEEFSDSIAQGKDEVLARREMEIAKANMELIMTAGLSSERRCNTFTWMEAICLSLYPARHIILDKIGSLKEFDPLEKRRQEHALRVLEALVIAETVLHRLGYTTELAMHEGTLADPTPMMALGWEAKAKALRNSAMLEEVFKEPRTPAGRGKS